MLDKRWVNKMRIHTLLFPADLPGKPNFADIGYQRKTAY